MRVRVIKDVMGYRPQVFEELIQNWVYLEEKGWFKKTYFTWINHNEYGSVCSSQEAAIDMLNRYAAQLDFLNHAYSVVYEADWS